MVFVRGVPMYNPLTCLLAASVRMVGGSKHLPCETKTKWFQAARIGRVPRFMGQGDLSGEETSVGLCLGTRLGQTYAEKQRGRGHFPVTPEMFVKACQRIPSPLGGT